MNILEIAKSYCERGWSVIPVPYKQKGPKLKAWGKLRLKKADLPKHFGLQPKNIGVLLGEPSGGLVDIDLDCMESVSLARFFLPKTEAIFGRKSKPGSHQLYKIKDKPSKTRFEFGPKKKSTTLAEIRWTGLQTVFPGSVHPSGEEIRWDTDGKPAEIATQELEQAVRILAAITLLVKYWPEKASAGQGGCRHHASLALAGGLVRDGLPDKQIELIVRAIVKGTGSGDRNVKLKNVRDTIKRAKDSQATTGWKTLSKYVPKKVISQVRRWLPSKNEEKSSYSVKNDHLVKNDHPNRLAEHYLNHRQRDAEGHLVLRRYREQWWHFKSSGYELLENEVLDNSARRHLDKVICPKRNDSTGETKPGPLRVTSGLVREVVKAISAVKGVYVEGNMPQWLDNRKSPDPSHIVTFSNGLLDIKAYCEEEVDLIKPTPAWFAAVGCPYDFDSKAECPISLRHFDEVFEGDAESIQLLQEWMGLNLTPDNTFERFMLFYGKPRSGKGVVIEMLTAMLGRDQVAVSTFSKIASRFGLDPLMGKLAVILPDAHVSRFTDNKAALEIMKSITGGDPQAVDRKGISELAHVSICARLTIAVNELPDLPDDAGALETRLLLIHFGKSFAGKEDTTRKQRVRGEAPGLAVWALEGLKRIQARLREQEKLQEKEIFTIPEKSRSIIREFKRAVSPVLSFIHECCIVSRGEDLYTPKQNLYEAWCDWCRRRGNAPGNRSQFGQKLVNTGLPIETGRRGPRGKQATVYKGIKLRPEYRPEF